ncbi:MAG: helix-turn-helix transcriptional regulator [Bacteroidales bacterium]|nr:helix-turn-helix transcriptional regulator [Bacteroidales bacterium]
MINETMAQKWVRSLGDSNRIIRNVGTGLIVLKKIPENILDGKSFRVNHHILLVVFKGTVKGKADSVDVEIGEQCISLFSTGKLIRFEGASSDFEGYVVMISPEFIEDMEISLVRAVPMRILTQLRHTPMFPLEKADVASVRAYMELLFGILGNIRNPSRRTSAVNLVKSFIYEAGFYMSKNSGGLNTSQQAPVLARLFPLIQRHFAEHRDVGFYADCLSMSPNHLYKIVKEASGKTVREWIEEYTIAESKSLLKRTDLNVQQIADKLNFQSQSLFGKYFKRLAGMSPKQYRIKALREDS